MVFRMGGTGTVCHGSACGSCCCTFGGCTFGKNQQQGAGRICCHTIWLGSGLLPSGKSYAHGLWSAGWKKHSMGTVYPLPVVYLQNSGIGNIINPVASLLNDRVYGIPCIFIVGWRGEPGVHDEPQHVFQGEVTLRLLEDMEIEPFVLSADTTEAELRERMDGWQPRLAAGKSVAIVVRKGALTYDQPVKYSNHNSLLREEVIRCITEVSGEDIIVSTTGKASRELFEIREAKGQSHQFDFLTVGSMGHSSSIALGIALNRPDMQVWCIDGDGAALMHMGAMALIGANRPKNLVHIVINNAAHETVGGMPTVAGQVDLVGVAKACGYPHSLRVHDQEDLVRALEEAKAAKELTFLEVCTRIGSRPDLGRPTTTPMDIKKLLMNSLGV